LRQIQIGDEKIQISQITSICLADLLLHRQNKLTNLSALCCDAAEAAHGHAAVAAVERRRAPKKQERDRDRQAPVEPTQLRPVAPVLRGGGGVRQADAVLPPPHRELVDAQLLVVFLAGVALPLLHLRRRRRLQGHRRHGETADHAQGQGPGAACGRAAADHAQEGQGPGAACGCDAADHAQGQGQGQSAGAGVDFHVAVGRGVAEAADAEGVQRVKGQQQVPQQEEQ